MTVEALPRTRLALLPTPLVRADRLSEALDLEVWLKRDDLTGLGLGGNKVRALEFLIGAAEADGADCFVTGGAPQSNWVMLAALAALTRGLEPHVTYFGPEVPPSGNLAFVRRLPGVQVSFTGDPDRASVDVALEKAADRLSAAGRLPYVVGRGGAGPVGSLGYLHATLEIDDQADGLGIRTIWTSTGSCGTQAGLVAGQQFSAEPRHVVGVSVHRPIEECTDRIESIAADTLGLVGSFERSRSDWVVLGSQLGRDPAAEALVQRAALLTARTEGVFLDPEFGAPAMAELIARSGEVDGPVLFLVTGGGSTLLTGGAFG